MVRATGGSGGEDAGEFGQMLIDILVSGIALLPAALSTCDCRSADMSSTIESLRSDWGSVMGQLAVEANTSVTFPHSLHSAAEFYVTPEIYRRPDVAARQIDLVRIISIEVLPRLLRLHAQVVPDLSPIDLLKEAIRPTAKNVDELADIVLGDDLEGAARYVTMLRNRGLSMETLYVELLEPTAQLLGAMWDNDECDFIDVTLGVARLQKLLAIFNETYALPQIGDRRHVFIATAPDNQHSFGASMIERLLSAAGWQVQADYSGSSEEIIATVQENWFAVVGLTVGSDRQLEALKAVIGHIRERALNTKIGVMVGGPIFTANPSLAVTIGADATAPNAPAAVLAAQKLFDLAIQDR